MKKELAECQYVGPTSQELLRRLKERGLKQISDFLDDDMTRFFTGCYIKFEYSGRISFEFQQ